jgi:hypothetical protein
MNVDNITSIVANVSLTRKWIHQRKSMAESHEAFISGQSKECN